MRKATIFVLATALVATPAAAQNETNEPAVDANAVIANDMLPADPTNMAMPANDMMVAPVAEPVDAAPAAPARERGFPWGVIGLVGLIGLLGRRRRND